mgnify:CR=1 FL=1
MKLVILSRYDAVAASSRLRTAQYVPFLEAEGFQVSTRPFFDATYISALYGGGSRKAHLGRYIRTRLADLRAAGSADVIWLEKEALPWLPWLLERPAWPRDVPVVSDHDDAVFHRYDRHRRASVRGLLGGKIDGVMAASHIVMAGNPYIADRARTAGAGHAAPMQRLIVDVVIPRGGLFRAIGARGTSEIEDGTEYLPWSEDTEVEAIRGMDVGIMPLDDSPWSRGKCGYKLIQYMACGRPVVASPTGVNTEIVEHGVNGFLARTAKDWRDALITLLDDPALRARMGAAGRAKVERSYSLQVWAPRVAALLRGAAG